MMVVVEERPETVPLTSACDALQRNRSTLYARQRAITRPADEGSQARRNAPQPRALSPEERDEVFEVLHSERFQDQPPAQVYHQLLEEDRYLCSISTLHRVLRAKDEHGERRNQRPPQRHSVPRLRATAPNEVWTWDITKLPTHTRGVYLSLYVVLDLFSRYVVAWMVSRKENAALATQLLDEAIARYRITPGNLTLHQDRGTPMIAHGFLDLLTELGVTPSHNRPHVSNDNPTSEAQFKTLKYQPDFPGKFDGEAHARRWCAEYFDWYDHHHHHSALAGFTPEQVFTLRYLSIAQTKQATLNAMYAAKPERFVNGRPILALPPSEVTINPITPEEREQGLNDRVNFPTLPRALEKYEEHKAQAESSLFSQ